jgi:uncharacterized protein YwqG
VTRRIVFGQTQGIAMTKDEAIDFIRSSPLADDLDLLVADLLPSIRIRARRAARELGPGESRLGGCPYLPASLQWPRYLGSTWEIDSVTSQPLRTAPKEVCLQFIAQLRLEDLPEIGQSLLPKHGSLCFFYDAEGQPWGHDPAENGGWRVLYFDEPAHRLFRTEQPVPSKASVFPTCQLSFAVEWTLPDYGVRADDTHDEQWRETLEELAQDLRGGNDLECFEPMHRFLGHAQDIQNDMRLDCELASRGFQSAVAVNEAERARVLPAGAADWRLLLQVDTDDDGPGWMWGDCGRLYYWMREQDLRQKHFDAARLVLQCT